MVREDRFTLGPQPLTSSHKLVEEHLARLHILWSFIPSLGIFVAEVKLMIVRLVDEVFNLYAKLKGAHI